MIDFHLSFDAPVVVTGAPQFRLNTGATTSVYYCGATMPSPYTETKKCARYAGGSGTSTLSFTYVVQLNDAATNLDYWNRYSSVQLGAASTIRRAALSPAVPRRWTRISRFRRPLRATSGAVWRARPRRSPSTPRSRP